MGFVVRQPVFDRYEKTAGYELFQEESAEEKQLLGMSLRDDIETLATGRRVFLNCDYERLLSESLPGLSPERVVIKISEGVRADEAALAACGRLKQCNHTILLSNFVPTSNSLRLLDYANMLSVDFGRTPPKMIAELLKNYGTKYEMIATGLDTRQQHKSAMQTGFLYFQGQFFSRPLLAAAQREFTPLRTNHFRLLQAACNPDLDFRNVEEIIKTDAALCYRLLRYLNSAAFCLQSSVSSIRHALALMGEREIRKWVAVIAASMAADEKSKEIVLTALLRARFAELIAAQTKCKPYDSFILGLFSLMDIILDTPLERILLEIEMPAEPRAALLGKPVRLRQVYDLLLAHNQADWTTCHEHCRALRITEFDLMQAYVKSVQWVAALTAEISA